MMVFLSRKESCKKEENPSRQEPTKKFQPTCRSDATEVQDLKPERIDGMWAQHWTLLLSNLYKTNTVFTSNLIDLT